MKKKYKNIHHKPKETPKSSGSYLKTHTQLISKKSNLFKTGNIPVLSLLILSIVLYINTIGFDYALDDMMMIYKNKFTKQGVYGIKDIMTNDAFVGFHGKNKNLLVGGRYRPLSQICFAIEYQFFGLSPFVGHLINILLYSLTCLLIFKVLEILFKDYKANKWYLSIPFIATGLFIAHPIHTEVVANIKSRDEIMSMLGAMATLYFVLKYIDKKKIIHLILSSFIFILAILSKENAITFFAVIPLTLFVFTKTSVKDYVAVIGSLSVAVIIYFVIRYNALGFLITNNKVVGKELLNNPFLHTSFGEKYATIFYTFGKYLQLILFPHPLTHDYYPKQIPVINWTDLRAVFSLLIYSFFIIYALIKIWKKDIIAYCILFFILIFSVSSNLVFNVGTFMNERFMFASSLGWTIIIAYLLNKKYKKHRHNSDSYNKFITVILLIIMLGYSIKTISRNYVWRNDFTLFTTDVKTSYNSAKCNVSAGGKLIEESDKEENKIIKNNLLRDAVKYISKGVEIHPLYIQGWVLLGNAYLKLDKFNQARLCFENCLRISSDYPDALTNLLYLAQLTNKKKDYLESIKDYKMLIKYHPDNYDYLTQLAGVYENVNPDTSITILNNIIASKPDCDEAYGKLGEIYGKTFHKIDTSFVYLMKAYKINPKNSSVLENIGIVYGLKNDFNKSIYYLKKALELNPNEPRLYMNIGGTYRNMGQTSKSKEYFLKAEQIKSSKKK